jgi:hypothetical protein
VVDPTLDMTAPIEQVARMNEAMYFKTLAALESQPTTDGGFPHACEARQDRVVPGQDCHISKLDPGVAWGLKKSWATALQKLSIATNEMGKRVNGWNMTPPNLGDYGTDYWTRAVVALIGLGTNLPADAIYPNAFVDAEGKPLSGANAAPIQHGWLARSLHPAGFAQQNQRGELAPGRGGRIQHPDADLLAEGDNYQRHLAAARCEEGVVRATIRE